MPIQDLRGAAKLIDQELERQMNVYRAAGHLREQFGATVQGVLDDLTTLDERRMAMAKEVGELEERLVTLRAEARQADVDAENARRMA